MGVSFLIYNFTRKQVVGNAIGYWKSGEWDWDQVIKIMNWNQNDEIKAISEEGDVYIYTIECTDWEQKFEEGDADEYLELKDEDEDEDEDEDDRWVKGFEKKYISEFSDQILDAKYSLEEYYKIINKK